MSDNCPFCAAELHPVKPKYCCGTPKFIEPIIEDYRTIECYQRQLAAKDALLREAVGFVKYFPLAHCGLKTEEGLRFTNLCGLVISKEVKDKAQDFLDKDEIKALMKEGPDADK